MLPAASSALQAVPQQRHTTQEAVPLQCNYYVEVVRNGMVYGTCSACGDTFMVGQLKLGFMVSQGNPSWVHVPRCTQLANIIVNPFSRIAFNPFVPSWEQHRVLEEMAQCPPRVPPLGVVLQFTQPWQYEPAISHSWPMQRLVDLSAFSVASAGAQLAAVATAGAHIAQERRSRENLLRNLLQAQSRRIGQYHAMTQPPPPPPPPPQLFPLQASGSAGEAGSNPGTSLAALLLEVPVYRLEKREVEQCVVCHEPMRKGEEVRRLPCFHVYHRLCIDRWLGVKATCPLDNQKLEDLVRSQQQMDAVCSRPDYPMVD